MVKMLRFHVSVVLRHILSSDRQPLIDERKSSTTTELANGKPLAKRLDLQPADGLTKSPLDFEGPKLIHGIRTWLIFYQLAGVINLDKKPFYLSVIYKIIINLFAFNRLADRFVVGFLNVSSRKGSFNNPIFLFITFLSVITMVLQILANIYVFLFNLCPMFKVLTTKRLCFLSRRSQILLGDGTLPIWFLFIIMLTTTLSLMVSDSWSHFVSQFTILGFLLDTVCITILISNLVCLTFLDLYIRSSFGHWLLAQRSHLERQFTYLNRTRRQTSARNSSCTSPMSLDQSGKLNSLRLVSLDELQRNLNHMDDHLEVLRSVQIYPLVLLTLNGFLVNGSIFLLAYHMIADLSDNFHGLLLFLVGLSLITIIFLSYSGDRWVFYALSSLVQTIEDEYFMRLKVRPRWASSSTAIAESFNRLQPGGQSLEIRRKDVLFCREFVHQFENHLATPWTKLTFKSHLHMLRTFVTLIAAQIIFDHEH